MHSTSLVGAAVTVVVLIWPIWLTWRAWRDRPRTGKISQWAVGRGWTVTPRPGGIEWASRLPGSERSGVSLIVSGTVDGWPVSVANYSYLERSEGANTRERYVVTAVRLPASYPAIAVQSRGGISRLGHAIFGDNSAATGHAEFDRQFRVESNDPATSRRVVGPALIAEHLAGQVPGWSLAGHYLLAWQKGTIGDPSRIDALAARLIRVASLIGR